jgi:hypothetical protein
MTFPTLPKDLLEQRLQPPSGPIRMVLDTDTYNEIDDQFAVVYALRSPEKLTVEALYAAPFTNNRSIGPGEGMEKSYDEIVRLLDRLHVPADGFVYRGSTAYLGSRPERSPAALDLAARAMAAADDDPLYVAAIGAITNVASALLIEPEILRKIVVVWLGGNPHVASHLLTTKAELAEAIAGRNPICDFLYERFCEYHADHFAYGKEIWDVATIAYLLDERWTPSRVVPSPRLMGEWQPNTGGHLYFEPAPERHPIRELWFARRNPIFRDLFTKLQNI